MLHPFLLANWLFSDSIWDHLFTIEIPLLEKLIRTVLVYLALMIGLRLSGKRELAQLNPFDLIVLLMLSNTVQNAMIGSDNSYVGGVVGAATLLILNYFIVRIVYGSPKLQALFGGSPQVLVRQGQVRKHKLQQELITRQELEAAAHRQGIASLDDVEKCVLEPTGTISFIQRHPNAQEDRHAQLVDKLNLLVAELAEARAPKVRASRNGELRKREFRGAMTRSKPRLVSSHQ